MSEIEPLEFVAVTRTFSEWILAQKRRLRPAGLYVVGVNGSIGQGKTYFCQAITSQLNTLLKPEEGQAITRSLDDYYLTHAERYQPEFLALGYNPAGISNRGPAGTHDTARLLDDIGRMDISSSSAVTGRGSMDLPAFDKQTDDKSPQPYRVQGKVGVFVLEGWFVGCKTDVDPLKVSEGLKRSVAQALRNYKPIFDRVDALWAFEPPATLEEIVAQRAEQEDTLFRQTGKTGMTPEQIRRFVEYFYRDSWQAGITSPIPPRKAASFCATTNLQHQFLKIEG